MEVMNNNELDAKMHDKVLRSAMKEAVRNVKRKFKGENAARKKRKDEIREEKTRPFRR